ncbi:MAG: carbohydrate kinase family protein [Bulleidia sp.]
MKSVCVIGGANIDVCGASIEPLRNYDSNPGTIDIGFGGVGRNIAQICALLKENVSFVTCFSDDSYGQLMKQDCEKMGMDCSMSKVVHGLPSSMYVAILDEDRDMRVAMSDMRILREMDVEMLKGVVNCLDGDDLIIIDANLDMESIEWILHNAPCPVAADPVSVSKCSRLRESVGYISIFKPNVFEAQAMSGITITDENSAAACLKWFLDRGVKEVLISMADQGVLLGTKEKCVWLKHRTITMENATGGGDTLLGAYVTQRLGGNDPLSSLHFSVTAAVDAIEQDSFRRRSLDPEKIKEKIREMEIKERELCM